VKDVSKTMTKILFYVLVGLLFVWTSSLTVSLAGRLFPSSPILPWFALCLFDFGALTWLLVFLKNAEGLPQRAISLLAFVLDLVGIFFASFAELFLGGQQLTAIPADLGTYVIWVIGGYTIINLAAAYAYHITEPAEMREIRMQTLRDRVQAEALDQVEAQITVEAQQLAAAIRESLYADVLATLHLPIPPDLAARLTPANVVEGRAVDVPTPAAPMHSFASDTEQAGGGVQASGGNGGNVADEEPDPTQASRRPSR
jgi:hypothetical protein